MGTDLIAEYLDALRVRLAGRRDVDDLVAEVTDHLRDDAERRVAAGCDEHDAAQQAVEAFGAPAVVAREYLTSPSGALAVPTAGTRSAGSLASIAAVLWGVVLVMWSAAHVVDSRDWPVPGSVLYFAGAGALLGAAGLTFAVAMALRDRHGRSIGLLGVAGLGFIGFGAATTTLLGWAVPVWMTLLAVGTALLAVSMLRRRVAPRLPAILLGIALPAGAVFFVVTRSMRLGNPDEFGDYPLPTLGALVIGCSLVAAALWAISSWLRSEEPYSDIEAVAGSS